MLHTRLNSCMLGLLLAAALLLPTGAASAGTYVVSSCTESPAHSRTGWAAETTAGSASGTPYFYSATNCAAFGFYRRFEVNTVAGGAYTAMTWTAPADTWIADAWLHQSITARSGGAYDALYAQQADGTHRLLANYLGATSAQAGDQKYTMPTTGAHTVAVRTELGCQATVSSCAGIWNNAYGNEWYIYGALFTLVDPSLPAFTSVDGAGWESAPADGVLPVNYSVADSGAGVASVHFQVDGIEQGSDPSACSAGAYVPCPLSTSGQFMLDTTRLSEGSHTVALIAQDYAGNETAVADPQLTVTVRRAPAVSPGTTVSTSNPSANGGGSPAVGDQLNGSPGSWSGSGNSYAYQWMRCDAQGVGCVPIDGANGVSYTAGAADVGHTLQFCVTATNSGGSATSCSAPTPVVVAAHPTVATPSDVGPSGTPVSSGGSAGSPAGSSAGRGTPNGAGATERVILTAVGNSRSSSRKAKFGKRVKITGRLLGANGAPIRGARLSVQTQMALPGAAMADAAEVITGSDGRFTYTAPAGPSRTIRFGYRAFSADSWFADTTDVHLLVKAGVTMKATPKKVRNRHATLFKGRVLGRPLSKRGVIVDLQVFFRHTWRTFAAPRTNRKGVYKFRYRFMAGSATWRFRARVRKESSYPYELGYSAKPVRVKVVG